MPPLLKKSIAKISLAGLILSGFLFGIQSLQNSLVYEIDPRLEAHYLSKLGIEQNRIHEANLVPFDVRDLPFDKPRVSLGFSKPLNSFRSGTIREGHYQLITSFDNHIRPISINAAGEMGLPKNISLYTADPFIFSRYQSELPKLQLTARVDDVYKKLTDDKNSIGIVRVADVKLNIKTLTPIIPVRLWMGWKESETPVLSHLGVNFKLHQFVSEQLLKADREKFPNLITIKAVGDIMLGRRIGQMINKKKESEPAYPFTNTMEFLNDADMTIGNLECAVSAHGNPLPNKDFTFRADPKAINQLKLAGFDLMVLSNNHAKDYGAVGLEDTIKHLKEAGIEKVGAGVNYADAVKPAIMTMKDGTRIGNITYSMIVPKSFLPGKKEPGVNWVREKSFAREIKKAKAQCDILIVQFHWGKEYEMQPIPAQTEYGRKAIDNGADLVIGHHPHWNQTVEFYKNGFIAYSLGNFVFDMNHRAKVTEGMILSATFKNKKMHQIALDPVHIISGEPRIVSWDYKGKRRPRTTILHEIYTESGF